METNIIIKISLFVLITFVLTILLALTQQQMNIAFDRIVLAQLAPMITFFLISFVFKDLKFTINSEFDNRILLKTILALVLPFVLMCVSYFIAQLKSTTVNINEDFTSVFMSSITGIIIGSIGEEIGWRSFLLPILENKYSALVSSIIVGLIWGLWHIGHYKNGLFFMLSFLIFTISASIILSYLVQGTGYNIIISVSFHTSVNLAFIMFFNNSLYNSNLMIVNSLVWLFTAVFIVMILTKGFILF